MICQIRITVLKNVHDCKCRLLVGSKTTLGYFPHTSCLVACNHLSPIRQVLELHLNRAVLVIADVR